MECEIETIGICRIQMLLVLHFNNIHKEYAESQEKPILYREDSPV